MNEINKHKNNRKLQEWNLERPLKELEKKRQRRFQYELDQEEGVEDAD